MLPPLIVHAGCATGRRCANFSAGVWFWGARRSVQAEKKLEGCATMIWIHPANQSKDGFGDVRLPHIPRVSKRVTSWLGWGHTARPCGSCPTGIVLNTSPLVVSMTYTTRS